MDTKKIVQLYQRANEIADQSFVKRAIERAQELLKIIVAEGFAEESDVCLCSGNGGSSPVVHACKVIYEDEPDQSHLSDNVYLDEYCREPDTFGYKLVITDKALGAAKELTELGEAIAEANLTGNVPWKIFANTTKEESWKG